MVVLTDGCGQCRQLQIVEEKGAFRLGKDRKQYRHYNADDCSDNPKFDESKAVLLPIVNAFQSAISPVNLDNIHSSTHVHPIPKKSHKVGLGRDPTIFGEILSTTKFKRLSKSDDALSD